jgi:hypothetical protein
MRSRLNSTFIGQMRHRFFETVDGQFEHREDLADDLDGAGIAPLVAGDGIEPDSVPERFGEKLKTVQAGPPAAVADVDGPVL